jgi:hypothetical protein
VGGSLLSSRRLARQPTLVSLEHGSQVLLPFGESYVSCCCSASALASGDGLLHVLDRLQDHSWSGEGARNGPGDRTYYLKACAPSEGFPGLGKCRFKDSLHTISIRSANRQEKNGFQ